MVDEDKTRQIERLFAVVKNELQQVEETMYSTLQDESLPVQTVTTHLLGGGKRLRPALILLSGRFNRYDPDKLVPVGAAIELIHMATLIHDDVVDEAEVRRGMETLNSRWGADISVLAGDYLYAKALSLVAGIDNDRAAEILAGVVERMCRGEIDQLFSTKEKQFSRRDYFSRIEDKTAFLIGECCRIGAVLSEAPAEEEGALARFGRNMGISFQIIDDILDFVADEEVLGKPVGSDLRSGVITLPIICAYETLEGEDRRELRELVTSEHVGDSEIQKVAQLLRRAKAFEKAKREATRYLDKAREELSIFDEEEMKEDLFQVAEFVVAREY